MLPEYQKDHTLFDGSTSFVHYSIIDTIYNNRPARILYTDNQSAAQSGLPFDNKPEMLFDYSQRFIEIVEGIKPKNVLILGGGAMTLPSKINSLFPEIYIDVFEIDGGLIELASKYFNFKQNSHLQVFIGDARQLLKSTTQKYDLILTDVFNSLDIPKQFNQPELPFEIKNCLNPKGLSAMNIIAAYYGPSALNLRKTEANFKKAFKNTAIFLGGDSFSLWMSQNFILLAGPTITKASDYLSTKSLDHS